MSGRRRGFDVGDRVQGKTGQIDQKKGYVLEILTGSRIRIKWDDGVAEVRAVDQIEQYVIAPSTSTTISAAYNANESCGFPGCREDVFIYDPKLKMNLCHVHVDAQKIDILKASQGSASSAISLSSEEDSDDEEMDQNLASMPADCKPVLRLRSAPQALLRPHSRPQCPAKRRLCI